MVILPLHLLILLLLPFAIAETPTLCGQSGNYASNSTYQANLRLLSSTLPKKAASNNTLFAKDIAGNVPDIVYALALCRGDTNASACESCVAAAFQEGQQFCAYNKEATAFDDLCTVKFSNINFLPIDTSNQNQLIIMDTQNFTTGADSVRPFLLTLLNSTAQLTANSPRRFATSRLEVNSLPTVYCLMQCTPDLTAADCAACFRDVSSDTLKYLDGKQGGGIRGVRCNMRYDINSFFQGDPILHIQPAAAPPQPTVQEQHGRVPHKSPLAIISLAASPLVAILLCFILFSVWMRRRRKGKVNLHGEGATNRPEEDTLVWGLEKKSSEVILFDFPEILHATGNFSAENRLGQGGFGPVYKGQLPDGMEIAVKRLASHSGQGVIEFRNEVELVAKLQHNNLVKLLGFCIQGEEKLLVYEYLPNKSLDFFIIGGNRTTLVDWNKLHAIIEGIAQGLLYLHKHSRLRIIHRDIKASNILLDKDMNPKISDFGLAKIFGANHTQGSTNRLVGTYGYMSPEYAYKGIYSIKSDVFSFGVLLLEILSGKRNSGFHHSEDFINLLGYSWHLWKGGRWLEILEASIAKEIQTGEARKYISIALMCVQETANDRPTMSEVVAMLNNESVILPEPNHPAYFNLEVHEMASVSCSNNDVTITAEPDGR